MEERIKVLEERVEALEKREEENRQALLELTQVVIDSLKNNLI